MSTWQALHPPLPDATPSAWQMVPLTSFLLDWLLVTGMNECHQSVKAVADVYNIKPHQIASLNGFAVKNLFWSYFTAMMVNTHDFLLIVCVVSFFLCAFCCTFVTVCCHLGVLNK